MSAADEADIARALDRVADALELIAVAYVQVNELDREELVNIYKALEIREFLGQHRAET